MTATTVEAVWHRGRLQSDYYVDPVAVERAARGDRVRLTVLERRAVVHRLTARGMSSRAIAKHVGISARTVVRLRSRGPVEVSSFG